MTCQQCGADFPEGATFCYKCGMPVRAVAFSYVPADAPPWPATVPPFNRSQANGSLHDQASESSSLKPARPARRSARGILSLIALLILAPVLGVGITLGVLSTNGQFPPHSAAKGGVVIPTPNAQSTTTPSTGSTPQSGSLPTPTSFQSIDNSSSSKMGLVMKYPGDWVFSAPQSTSNSIFIDMHPSQQQLGIDMVVERFTASASSSIQSTNVVNQNNLNAFSQLQGVQNLQMITPTVPQRTLGGVQWDEMDGTFTNTNGLLFHLTTIAVQHNHVYYDMEFYCPDSYYNEAVQKYFQPMFDSFKFLS